MNIMLDIVGSFILFGILLLTVLTINSNLNVSSIETFQSLTIQQNLVELVRILDYDFLKMGYGANKPRLQPGSCDSTEIMWLSDNDDDGVVDTVGYFWGRDTVGTSNPRDSLLYRQVGNNTQMMNLGVVSLKFTYYDTTLSTIAYADLDSLSGVNSVRGVRVRITLESLEKIGETYSSAYIEKTYYPRNIRIN